MKSWKTINCNIKNHFHLFKIMKHFFYNYRSGLNNSLLIMCIFFLPNRVTQIVPAISRLKKHILTATVGNLWSLFTSMPLHKTASLNNVFQLVNSRLNYRYSWKYRTILTWPLFDIIWGGKLAWAVIKLKIQWFVFIK